MRLIYADALPRTQIVERQRVLKNGRLGMRHVNVNVVRVEDVENAHTVDAVPVVHARWVICSDGYYPYCSECKEEPKHGEMTKYCPNCGARMDGDAT